MPAEEGEEMMKTRWYKNAVVYQIYPFSFMDSNNDGWGDIEGILSKLDYIRDLGVTAIWFSPLYKSPDYDYGYDVSDYRAIDEKFGTMEDFDRLLSFDENGFYNISNYHIGKVDGVDPGKISVIGF